MHFCKRHFNNDCRGVPGNRGAPLFFIPKGALTHHLPRRRKLHIPRFAASGKARSFRCSSSPYKVIRLCGDPLQAVVWPCGQRALCEADAASADA